MNCAVWVAHNKCERCIVLLRSREESVMCNWVLSHCFLSIEKLQLLLWCMLCLYL